MLSIRRIRIRRFESRAGCQSKSDLVSKLIAHNTRVLRQIQIIYSLYICEARRHCSPRITKGIGAFWIRKTTLRQVVLQAIQRFKKVSARAIMHMADEPATISSQQPRSRRCCDESTMCTMLQRTQLRNRKKYRPRRSAVELQMIRQERGMSYPGIEPDVLLHRAAYA